MSRAQISALLAALDKAQRSHTYTRGRNRRAVCLMLYAGLRLAETAGLRRGDIDMDARTIMVRGEHAKGGKARMVPICDELFEELAPCVDYSDDWAIVDQGDTDELRGKPLHRKSLAHVFERWLPKRGVDIHAHRLRKTFATQLHARGVDVLTISGLLGHRDIKTTQRYIGKLPHKHQEAVATLTFRAEDAQRGKH